MKQNFGGRKFWQILLDSPIKKIEFEKLSYREYLPIYYLPIIATSSFAKIFSLKNSRTVFIIANVAVTASALVI